MQEIHITPIYLPNMVMNTKSMSVQGPMVKTTRITDKVTSVDMLRMAESLNAKVVIPVHYDIWSNFMADPKRSLKFGNSKGSPEVWI